MPDPTGGREDMGSAYLAYAERKPLEYRLMFGTPWPEPAQHPELVKYAVHAFDTRRDDKAPVFFQSGNVGVAVRASSAVPRIISPVGINGTEFEDADESLPVAVRAARQAGAQFVIAIDVSARAGAAPRGTSQALLDRDARRRRRIEPEVATADFLIHPDLEYAAGPSRSYFVKAQATGERSARDALPDLVERLRLAGLAGKD